MITEQSPLIIRSLQVGEFK